MTATVTTDKLDYAPGTTAWIAASNDASPGLDFAIGETVRFHVTRNDGAPNDHPGHAPWQVTDGLGGFATFTDGQGITWSPDLDGAANGQVSTSWFVAPHFNGAALRLTATGLSTGAVATRDFTDSSLVNTTTTGTQLIGAETPRTVAFDASGNFVVVWSGNGAETGQVDDSGIFAQRYNSAGTKVGGEVLVNTTTTGVQSNPSISMADNGDFVVSWSSQSVTTGWDIYARRFTLDGTGQIIAKSTGGSTNEFLVNSATSGTQRFSSVAMENDGAFTIVYRNDPGNRIDRRHYDTAGTGGTISTVVSLSTAVNPSAAITDDLRRIAVWYEPTGIYAQIYNAAGTAVGTKFAVATTNVQLAVTNYPQVAMDANGNFVVLWRHSNLNQFTFQRYNASAVAQGSPTDVMTDGGFAIQNASLSMNGLGEFAVSWNEVTGNRPVKVRVFNASGTATRTETVFDNASYTGDKVTSLALDDAGRIAVAWSGSGPGDADGVFTTFYPLSAGVGPTITSVSPVTGCTTGGTSVVITGTGFTGATAVKFGATNATSFTVDSSTQITAVAPASAASTVDVSVTTPSGTNTNTSSDNFTYTAAAISALSVGSQSASMTYGTSGSVTYSVGATRASDCSIVNATYTVSGLPAGVTGSLSPASGVSSSGTNAIPGSTLTLTVPSTINAGSYNFTVTLTNGSEVVSNTGTLTVGVKALTVTASNRSKTYGDPVTFAGTEFTTSGLVNSDSVSSVTLTSASAAVTAAVGTASIVPSAAVGSGLGNYTISYTNGTLTVNAKALSITANNQTKTVGSTLTFAGTEFTSSGLVNSDSVTSVTLASTGAASGAAAGTYAIVASAAVGSGLGNYTIGYTDGTLTVSSAGGGGAASVVSGMVNTTTTSAQTIGAETPRTVAFDASGNYVVVWSGNGAQTGQVDDAGIFAQRFNSSGVKVGGEVRVNTTTTSTQANPVISMADNGDFVVAWGTLNATTGWDIAARRFTIDGTGQIVAKTTGASTNEFVVAANSGTQRYSSVAMENDGAFVISYRNDAGNRIDRRRYDAAGVASTAVSVVSLTTAVNSSTAIADDLRSVVVWYEPTGIYGQLYNTTGAASGTKFTIATTNVQLATTNYPQVAMDATGNFVVLWRHSNLNQYTFQRYNAAGVAQGSATDVMNNGGFAVQNASLAMNGTGEFVVAWNESTGNQPVKFRQFNASGVATRSETVIDNATYGASKLTSVAIDDSNRVAVAWSGSGDGDTDGVFYSLSTPGAASPAPTVTAVSPTPVCTTGGVSVVITGTNLTGATAVNFGATAATSFTVDSATQITAVVPSGTAGTVDVTVTTPNGTSSNTAADDLVYSSSSLASLAVGAQTGSVTYGTAGSPTFAISATRASACNITGASYTVTGLPAGVTGSLSPATGVNSSGNSAIPGSTLTLTVGATVSAGSYPFTVTLTNGSETVSNTGTLVVSTKALTVTASARSKTYGDAVTFAGTEFTTSGLVNSDSVSSVTLTSTGAAATASVGSYNIVPSAASGSGLANYTITYSNGSLTVGTKSLTVTANNRTKTVGQTVTFAGTEFTTSGLVNSDSVSSVTLTSTGAGAGAAIGTYNIVPSAAVGSGLNNYSIGYTNGTLTVVGLDPTITSVSPATVCTAGGVSVVISGANFTNASAVKFGATNATSYTVDSDSQITAVVPAGTAGNVDISVTTSVGTSANTVADNFTYSSSSITSLTVGSQSASLTYGAGTSVTFAVSATRASACNITNAAYTVSGLPAGVTGTLSPSTGVSAAGNTSIPGSTLTLAVGATVNAGSYPFTVTLTNGAEVVSQSGTLVVSAKSLTITANNRSKTYGTAVTFAGTEFTTSGLVNSDAVSSVTLTSTGAAATAAVGTSSIVPSAATGTGLSNYTISYSNGTMTVNAKTLTVTANDNSKTYGTAITFTGAEFTTSGLVNSDTVSSVTLTSAGAAATGSAGTHNIVPSAATGTGLSNYTINYTNGTLTVNAKALSITANDRTKTYGTAVTFAGTEFTTSGLVNSDTVSSVTLTSAGAAATGSAGTHNIVPSAATGTGLANYTISYNNGTMTVNTKALTITASDRTKTYGTAVTFAGTEFTTSGLVNSDTVTGVTLTSTGAAGTASVGTSTIVASAATGTGLANYSISYTDGTMTVNAKTLTITASDRTKTYGTAVTFAGTEFTTSGLVNSDSVTSVTLTSSGDLATAAATTYSIVPSAATGTGLSNYTISYTNGTLTVNAKALTITADNQSKTEGNLFTFAGTEFTSSGLVNSDSISGVTLTSSATPTTATPGTYPIVPSAATGTGLGNYSITYTNGSFLVNPIGPLPDIIMTSASTSNATTLRVVYSVAGATAPSFTLVVARSSDDNYDGADTTLFTTTISLPADLSIGAHTKDFTIGTGAGQVALPGLGSADSNDDYNLIVVADPANLINEGDADPITTDNQVRFIGAYSNGAGTVLVHGTTGNDTISVASNRVTINAVNYTISTATTTAMRFRAGSGNDTVTASTFANLIHGGPGADTLNGGALADTLYGDGGNDALNGNGGNDTYVFDLDEVLGADTLSDASGTDTIDFSPSTTQAASINLGSTLGQAVHATNLTLTLASATSIENLTGGSLGDSLTGNSLNNVIFGGDGNDTLVGGTGNDTFAYNPDAASGVDSIDDAGGNGDGLDFSLGGTAVTVSLGTTTTQTVNANIGLTLLSATVLENIVGSSGNDSLTGNTLANSLTGGAGDDSLSGAGGNDSFLFDADSALGSDTVLDTAGTDTLNFSATTTVGININLKTYETLIISGDDFQTMNANHRLRVFFGTTIENVTGTETNDTIAGGTPANTLNGGGGNDTISGDAGNDIIQGGNGVDILAGNAGNDALNGGAGDDIYQFDADSALGSDSISDLSGGGTDILDFSSTTTRTVTLNLATTTSQIVNANLTLSIPATSQVEGVIGTSLADTITGNAIANILVGLGGNDVLSGAAARDLVIGGADADTLTGGDEEDLLIAGSTTYDTVAASLAAILAKWTSVATYETRRADLLAGTGTPALTAGTTVNGDAGADSLTGNLGRDLFFAALGEVTDQAGDENLETI